MGSVPPILEAGTRSISLISGFWASANQIYEDNECRNRKHPEDQRHDQQKDDPQDFSEQDEFNHHELTVGYNKPVVNFRP